MKCLYEILEKNNAINQIKTDSIEKAILEAYTDNIYKVVQNSELIDINDRFRIFNYQNVNYIVKTVSRTKGKNEYNNSKKCVKLLNGIVINNYTIEVVVPQLFEIHDKNYILTEYKGTTLQENLYCKKNYNTFQLNDLKLMIKIFRDFGIEYKGLSPRNMVIKDDKIYLFDLEDVIFYDKINYFNLLYKTNILINWTYFFKKESLEIILNFPHKVDINEPSLNSYEYDYKKMLGFEGNDYELRENIMKVVLSAEKSIDRTNLDYYIIPIDVASIISDLFNFNMDAIMDMTFSFIRKKNEKIYKNIIFSFSNITVYLYKNSFELKPYLLPILLLAIDIIQNERNFDSVDIYSEIFSGRYPLLNVFFDNDSEKFSKILADRLNILFKWIYSDYTNTGLDIDGLSNYLLSFSVKFDKKIINCYNRRNFS